MPSRLTITLLAVPLALAALRADDSTRLLTLDHFVPIHSSVPLIAGQTTQIYVRERVEAGRALRGGSFNGRVVLFVHGAGTPSEVAFDVAYQDYSWMAYLAASGFDVFAMDATGYGRSTRPGPMNDPCNLAADRQVPFVATPCAPTYPHQLTTIASDWNDIGGAVNYIRALRHVERVSLIAWSLGGPRAGGYAAQYPQDVDRLVLLAPAYARNAASGPPTTMPAAGVAMNTQSREEFYANWDRQVGCPDQYDPMAGDSVWSAMLASDPVGATWGPGVRRAPGTTVWGWNSAMAAKLQAPTLLFAGAHDKQVVPDRVRELYTDLGTPHKAFVDLACASHNAIWERNHRLMFRASLEWLTAGTVNGGVSDGVVRMGY